MRAFAPEGHVLKVGVDAPVGLPASAARCVEAALASAKIAEFGGRPMTIGVSWVVP